LSSCAQDKAVALKQIGELQKTLRRIPVIELSTPTVVLVGAPNVGKSTIVRAVSSGTPEVRAE
jgi:nucleolar GTP-binding protein